MRAGIATVLCIFALALCAFAQNSAGSSDQERTKPAASAEHEHGASGSADAEEAEGQDPNAQFKQSTSVKWVAHQLGVSVSTAYWICVGLNFLIIAVLTYVAFFKTGLAFMSMPAIPKAAAERRAEIQKQFDEAQRASDDANRRLREIENKLGKLGAEISQLNVNAAAQAQSEDARSRAAAEEEKQRLLRNAEQEIAATAANARRELRAFAAQLAVELAEKQIRIDTGADQQLVRNFTDQLGRDGN